MTALLRYQAANLFRSQRWIFPLIAYALLISVGGAGWAVSRSVTGWTGARPFWSR